MSLAAPEPQALHHFPCKHCGARLEYKPGSEVLVCPYCGSENAIPKAAGAVEELDYAGQLARLEHEAPRFERDVVKCQACAATVEKPANLTAFSCPFCGSNIVATAHVKIDILPGSVLPFAIARDQAIDKFRVWVRSRWFAPTALRRESFIDATVSGTYLPAWTYDTEAASRYEGQRGDAYYVTEFVTINGRSTPRQVRRVRWTSVSGAVANSFDDVLVMATRSLPEKRLYELEPWDLARLEPYADDYLAGFRAECYTITLPEGFDIAKGIMRPTIEATVRSDIGGDEQRISALQTRYDGVTYKHILLPVWISAYRFHNRVFQFLVNARTGEVTGERPYSAVKIALLVIVIMILVAIGLVVAHAHR